MSSNSQVRLAWSEHVFQHINDGENAYDYQISTDSENELSKFHYNQRVDAWMYIVTSSEVPFGVQITQITFTVTVKRYLQQINDKDGSHYNELLDGFRTVNDYVQDNLTVNWDSTIDYYTGPSAPNVSSVSVAGTPCWLAEATYTGIKQLIS